MDFKKVIFGNYFTIFVNDPETLLEATAVASPLAHHHITYTAQNQ